jgi:hypothetical protein
VAGAFDLIRKQLRRPTVPAFKNYSKTLAHILASLSEQGRAARDDHGVLPARQLLELLVLRAGRGKLRADEYYKLRLYRRDMRFSDKRRYASNSALPRDLFGRWSAVANDKLLTYSVLSDSGIRVPAIHAICHNFRQYRDRPTLRSIAEVAGYLRGEAVFPLIAKPVAGIYSEGVYLLGSFDAAADSILLEGDGDVPVETFAKRLLSAGSGYVLQEFLRPHQEIRQSISDRLCTLRVIVLLERNGPRLFMAVWKINLGGNVADNYWRKGNLLAKIDQDSGEILHCVTGLGPKFQTVDRHPETGRPLAGFRVPAYRDAIDLALRASRSFPGIPMQAWDIAITDDGPIPLEVNVAGNLFIPQLVSQKGILGDNFHEFVRSLRGSESLTATG